MDFVVPRHKVPNIFIHAHDEWRYCLLVPPTTKESEMVIDGNAAGPLLEQFKLAQDAEGDAVTALHNALKAGIRDDVTLMALTDHMTEMHNKKMDIWDQLQQFRLDK